MILDQAERAKAILNDLIRYTGQPEEVVRQRCKYSAWELAYQWPKYKDRTLEFYRESDLYIFDLTLYQSLLVPTVNHMVEAATINKFKKVLDLGGGIGEYTIRFTKEAECDVTYLDLENSETVKYAAWRIKRAGIEVPMVTEKHEWHNEPWDCIIAMDVIEHMDDETAAKTMEAIRKNVKFVYCNPEDVRYNELYPQHITRFTMEGFEKIDIDLYKNKAL